MRTITITPESEGVTHVKDNLYEWDGGKFTEPTNLTFARGIEIFIPEGQSIDTGGGDILMTDNLLALRDGSIDLNGGHIKMRAYSRIRITNGNIFLHGSSIDLADSNIFIRNGRIDLDGGRLLINGHRLIDTQIGNFMVGNVNFDEWYP